MYMGIEGGGLRGLTALWLKAVGGLERVEIGASETVVTVAIEILTKAASFGLLRRDE